MQWTDSAIVLGGRRHGENAVILDVLTRAHGRHLGVVRGGAGRRQAPVLQPGNSVSVTWSARIEEQLGQFVVEPMALRAAGLIGDAGALYGLTTLVALARLLPERDPHPGLHDALDVVIGHLDRPALAAALTIRFEMMVLAELGFGLDLSACAATGTRDDLIYVSPKSGRAVSRGAGVPYAGRLFDLPPFLIGAQTIDAGALEGGFRLTGHFLERHLFGPRGLAMPEHRDAFRRVAVAALKDGDGAGGQGADALPPPLPSTSAEG
jgi:DNA repair protein RecO (recombination protein O)